jgi:hypothetical protein
METLAFDDTVAIDFAGTCDLAIWCKLLHDKGWSGPRIARAIAKSEGYINNLIRVVERASPSIMLRWRAEQRGHLDHTCATDWLVAVCVLPHDRQDSELARRIAARPGARGARAAQAGDAQPDASHASDSHTGDAHASSHAGDAHASAQAGDAHANLHAGDAHA